MAATDEGKKQQLSLDAVALPYTNLFAQAKGQQIQPSKDINNVTKSTNNSQHLKLDSQKQDSSACDQ